MAMEATKFVKTLGIKMLRSAPYYAQANRQAQLSNKILIKKKIHDYPKRWHEVLSEALWAHKISRHGATKVIPLKLVYGQEVVLPAEVNLDALRFAKQNKLLARDYYDLTIDNIDEAAEKRVAALCSIEK
jgi:hypothetical protein